MAEKKNDNINPDIEDDIIEIVDEAGDTMPYRILADCEWEGSDYVPREWAISAKYRFPDGSSVKVSTRCCRRLRLSSRQR